MENRIETSHGVEVPRKSRSLDLKSLYEARATKDAGNNKSKRKAVVGELDEDSNGKKKKKKSVKEVSLSSLKNPSGNGKKNVERVSHNGSKDSKPGSDQKSNGDIGFKLVRSFDLSDEFVHIPRRKRGFVGRKKFEAFQAVDLDRTSKLGGNDSATLVESSKVKERKESFDDFKENRNSESNSSKLLPEEEEGDCAAGRLTASKGESSSKKSRSKRSKAKSLAREGKVSAKKTEPLVKNSATVCNDSRGDAAEKPRRKRSRAKKVAAPESEAVAEEAERLVENSAAVCDDSPEDDDEENLEENAAMMLSSRFDPNCTGFSSNKGGSALPTVEGLSFLLSSDHDFVVDHRSKSHSESESPSVDTAGRILRPRKRHKEKGNSRKRRHFYEVFFGDLDAFWLLNRRIKVFWPLDQTWYYGLVNEYDEERKIHHVKYDDRDEEWINLQSERFKLLLLPSEVPDKSQRKRFRVRNKSSDQRKGNSKPKSEKGKEELPTKDDNCAGSSNLDSEPIISWLARSRRRVKSPFHSVKKQKSSDPPTKPVPQPLLRQNADNGHRERGSARREKRKASRNSNSVHRFADAMKEESTSESIGCPKDSSKMPIVYFRRRLRKADQELSPRCDENHGHRTSVVPVSSFAPYARTEDAEKLDVFLGSLGPGRPLWSVDDAGLLKLILPGLESGRFKFHLSFPAFSVRYLYELFGTETVWLCRAVMLLHYGAVTMTWPQVHLEILFVDNVVGLKFLLFEGCLTKALAFVFLVLTAFHNPTDRARSVDLQLPVTSVRFKLTCFQHLRKQLLFAFYNYSEVENTKWMYLDWKLKRHCLLSKQLPLSECTYDNIQTLQNKEVPSSPTSQCGHPSPIKGTQRRFSQGSGFMGISGSDLVDIEQFSHSDEMYRKLSTRNLSVSGVPAFFLSLHLKLLLNPSLACVNFRDNDSVQNLENTSMKVPDDHSSKEVTLNRDSEVTLSENRKTHPGEIASDACFSSGGPDLSSDPSIRGDRVCTEPSRAYHDDDASTTVGTSAKLHALAGRDVELEKCTLSSRTVVGGDKLETDSESFRNGLSIKIPANQFGRSVDEDLHDVQQPADLSWNTNGGIFPIPNPTAPRSSSNRNKHSSPFGSLSHGWSDGKADLVYNGFGSGPRKPRTQVSYTLPMGGFDFSPKQKSSHRGILPPKRIRKASIKRSSDVFRGPQKNLESLSCDVNILVTAGDRGWRENGAKVVLQLFDHNEWRLAVKLSGATKYSYKAHQFLQPGSTNRYTHAMMWKGGKDWILEFFDRSQWALFKEMHEECHNRNVRASVKNIPIPGVRVIEEGDDNGTEIPFVRSSSKYIRQVESDIEMALNPMLVLYDMDSDDERWVQNSQNSSEFLNNSSGKVSEEMFEKAVCVLEKAAYAQQRDQFSSDEIEELMVGVGHMDIIRGIYEHWQQKRLRIGMPLIRHLQSPSWERYQQQMVEWELALTKMNASFPDGIHEKAPVLEKPSMFAFCMKPRGLEVPNKGSKQRSHRKISLSSHHSNIAFADQDGYHTYGRRSNGFSHGDERFVYSGHNYDSLDDSPMPRPSPRMFSPRDAGLDRSRHRKFHRSKSRNHETAAVSPGGGLYSRRTAGNRHEHHRQWRRLQPEESQRQLIERHFEGSDLDELRLREAAGAAKSALIVAKLRRERARRLACRADLAIHKAAAALMTADASKDCSEGSNCNG